MRWVHLWIVYGFAAEILFGVGYALAGMRSGHSVEDLLAGWLFMAVTWLPSLGTLVFGGWIALRRLIGQRDAPAARDSLLLGSAVGAVISLVTVFTDLF